MSASMTATLTDARGNTTPLDKATYAAVRAFLQALGVPTASSEKEDDARLTTGQAAEILGTSARTVARLIDSGKLAGCRMGAGHRTVMLSDVMEFKRASEASARVKLERSRDVAAEAGYYETTPELAAYLKELG